MTVQKNTHPTPPAVIDEEYKEAIKAVADDNMRTDVLGPHFCKVLENHTPASDAIVKLVAGEISSHPDLKRAIKQVIEEHNKETKMKWVDRIIGGVIGAVGVIILSVLIWFIEHSVVVPTTPVK